MKKKKKNNFQLPLIVTILGTVFGGIVLWILNRFFGLLSFSAIYDFLISKLNYYVPIWLILIVVAVVFLAIWIIKKITKEKPPIFLNYTEDRFFEWKWSWKYRIFGNKFEVIKLKPHCPKCDIPMIEYFDMIERYRCPMCGYHTVQNENPNDIEHIINHRVEEMQKYKLCPKLKT